MDSTMAFLAFCLLVLSHCALLTSTNSISSLSSLSETNAADANLDTSFLIRILNSASESSPFGEAEASHKRSASNAINRAVPPAAFVMAEDLSVAQLGEFLREMREDGTGISASVGCSGEVVEHTAADFTTSPASDNCTATDIPAFNDKPNTRGLCPWKYINNTNPNRYPSTITYAQCDCSNCQNEHTHEIDTDLGCHPIYYDVKVLFKHACLPVHGGIHMYERGYERVPVACACLRTKRTDE